MLWYLLHLFINVCIADRKCNFTSQCSGQTVQDSGVVHCRGFDSCSEETTIITAKDFAAYGAYSAYNAKNITSNEFSRCRGESSCRNVGYLAARSTIECSAYKSCFNSTISGDPIYLRGYKSGAYSTFNLYQQNTY